MRENLFQLLSVSTDVIYILPSFIPVFALITTFVLVRRRIRTHLTYTKNKEYKYRNILTEKVYPEA